MSEENNTGNNLIWAITTLIIVAIIAGALYYSGFLSNKKTNETDVKINITNSR
jgi:outer membrane murein-binding lipoprotein Lpp